MRVISKLTVHGGHLKIYKMLKVQRAHCEDSEKDLVMMLLKICERNNKTGYDDG